MKITEWSQVIGHTNTINLLRQQLRDNTVRDVILFAGSSGIGKSSMAKLLACDLVSGLDSEKRAREVQSVILDDKSTEDIKLFNMSKMRENEEEIAQVVAEMSMGFVTGGHKVVICDEAHGMSKLAQDAILTELENLEMGIHVIFITTEINTLRKAIVGRCRTRLQLRNLNNLEISKLIEQDIRNRGLQFSIPQKAAITMISFYADNEPRSALNLLSNFKDGSYITNDELSIFMNTNNVKVIIQLVKYLYGSLLMGMDYISTIELDNTFVSTLIEITKVALGGKSNIISNTELGDIQQILRNQDINHLLRFTIDVASRRTLTVKNITADFMKNHYSLKVVPEYDVKGDNLYKDLATIEENVPDELTSTVLPVTESNDNDMAIDFASLLMMADNVKR